MTDKHVERVLIIDDDMALTQLMSQFLEKNGYQVDVVHDGDVAIDTVQRIQPDLIVLDLMLPGTDGLTICKHIRPHFFGPIIMLTALVDDIDEVTGLEVGADDYLCKPLKPRVLLAHIRAQLRRQGHISQQHTAQHGHGLIRIVHQGHIRIDVGKRMVWLHDKEIILSSAEFDLLWLLAESAGEIRSRDQLHQEIFKLAFDGMDRSIDLRISRLRKKLGDDPKEPQIIKTIRNKGYLIAD